MSRREDTSYMAALDGLLADIRFALRALFHRPGFTAVSIITLALGIGANAAIFSIANAVLLRPLPFREPAQLVRVLAQNVELGITGAGLALGDFDTLRRQSHTLAELAAYNSKNFDLTGDPSPEVVRGAQVTPNLFQVLGMGAAWGRTFLPEEENPSRGKVAVISNGFWRRRFGGSPSVFGRTIQLDGEQYEIVGVMPARFRFPKSETEVWVPLTMPAEELDRMSHYLGAIGRLAQGSTPDQAGAELSRLAASLAETHPDTNKGWNTRVVRLTEHLTAPVRPALLVLSGAVGLLLLIACVNVANLLLARGAARQRETAIRAALGAPRPRLIQLFLVESTLLALLGGIIGFVLTLWAVDAMVAAGPADFPRLAEIDVDRMVLFFSLGLALVSGLAFGVFPALQLSRLDLSGLTQEGRGMGERTSSRLRSSLVVSEFALALVLLLGAALMLQGFARLSRIDLGFDPDQTLAMQILLSPNRYPEVPPQVQFFERLLTEIRALPGVVSTAAASAVPLLSSGQNQLPFEVEGRANPEVTKGTFASFTSVTPGYFHTLHIPLLQGRDFTDRDNADSSPVLVIDEVMKRRFWPNESAVGKHLRATIQGTEPISYEIVGVVGAVRDRDLMADPQPAIYAPYLQVPPRGMIVVLRTSGKPLRVAKLAQSRVLSINPDQPVFRTTTLDQIVAEAGARTRFYTALISIFAAIGLSLAVIGIYGVIAYSVTQRTQEMAVRVALGARSDHILRLVIGGGLKLALAGVVLGLAGAFALTRLLASLLYGVSTHDPITFIAVPLLLLGVAFLACYLPARQAFRVDPMLPLRQG
jgi:putative ABC transport system permease protein